MTMVNITGQVFPKVRPPVVPGHQFVGDGTFRVAGSGGVMSGLVDLEAHGVIIWYVD